MKVRPAKKSDLPEIMSIVSAVRRDYFEKNGIPQWNDGYPEKEIFLSDLDRGELFALSQGENIIGMVTVSFEHEDSYDVIEDGGWRTDGEYAVIHRLAVSPDFHGMGLGAALINLADKLCEQRDVHCVRCDTHEHNAAMRKTLEKCGFRYCGVIHIANGEPRVAYDKLI